MLGVGTRPEVDCWTRRSTGTPRRRPWLVTEEAPRGCGTVTCALYTLTTAIQWRPRVGEAEPEACVMSN